MMTFGVHASELGCKHHFVTLKKHRARISSFLPSHPDFRFLVPCQSFTPIRTFISSYLANPSLSSCLPFLMSCQSFLRILSHDFTGLSVVFGVRFGEFKRKIH